MALSIAWRNAASEKRSRLYISGVVLCHSQKHLTHTVYVSIEANEWKTIDLHVCHCKLRARIFYLPLYLSSKHGSGMKFETIKITERRADDCHICRITRRALKSSKYGQNHSIELYKVVVTDEYWREWKQGPLWHSHPTANITFFAMCRALESDQHSMHDANVLRLFSLFALVFFRLLAILDKYRNCNVV